jgi:hypothetical protein
MTDPECPRACFVTQDLLGPHLLPDETVHHRKGVREDNRPQNLELWTRPQASGTRVSDAGMGAQDHRPLRGDLCTSNSAHCAAALSTLGGGGNRNHPIHAQPTSARSTYQRARPFSASSGAFARARCAHREPAIRRGLFFTDMPVSQAGKCGMSYPRASPEHQDSTSNREPHSSTESRRPDPIKAPLWVMRSHRAGAREQFAGMLPASPAQYTGAAEVDPRPLSRL